MAFLYYILDDKLDPHYADCLVELNPTAYIWYRLRQQDSRQNIVFFSMDDEKLCTDTFDPESEEFLNQPAGFLSLWRRKPTDEELFEKLLSSGSSGARTTLVFTHDAFDHTCRISNAQGQKKLKNLMEQPDGKNRICIRLPFNADPLSKLVHTPPADCDILTAAYAPICQAADTSQLPLLEVLSAQLGHRLLRFDRSPGEMRNLLMMHAIQNPKIAATMTQLEDQAAYLDLCRRYRTPWLAAAASETDRSVTVSRKRMNTLLDSEDFVRKLCQRVGELRSKYGPDVTMEYILRRERLILDDSGHLVYNDRLANSIRSLTLPDEFLQHSLSDQIPWSAVMEQIRRNLTVLWNKPRNEYAMRKAEELWGHAREASDRKIWPTLDTVLRLLQFFSNHICLPADQTAVLEKCWPFCEDALKVSNYLYGDRSFGLPSGFDKFINTTLRAGNEAYLDQLKSHLNQIIQTLEKPSITVTDMVGELESDKNRIMADLSASNRQIEQKQARIEAEEQARQEAELLNRYTPGGAAELQPEDFLRGFDAFDDYHTSAVPAASMETGSISGDDAMEPEDPFRFFDAPTLPGMADDPSLQSIGSSLWPEPAVKDNLPCDNNSRKEPDFSWD